MLLNIINENYNIISIKPLHEKQEIDVRNEKNMSVISSKYGISMDMLQDEVQKGMDIESKFTNDNIFCFNVVLSNLKNNISYYSDIIRLKNLIKNAKKQ